MGSATSVCAGVQSSCCQILDNHLWGDLGRQIVRISRAEQQKTTASSATYEMQPKQCPVHASHIYHTNCSDTALGGRMKSNIWLTEFFFASASTGLASLDPGGIKLPFRSISSSRWDGRTYSQQFQLKMPWPWMPAFNKSCTGSSTGQ